MARAASGQAGTTSGGDPTADTENRPRLNAIWSRIGSRALRSTLRVEVAGSRRPAAARDPSVLHRLSDVAPGPTGLATVTRRVALVQRSDSWRIPVAPTKTASLPPGMVTNVQLPDAIGAKRGSNWTGAVAGNCAEAADALSATNTA